MPLVLVELAQSGIKCGNSNLHCRKVIEKVAKTNSKNIFLLLETRLKKPESRRYSINCTFEVGLYLAIFARPGKVR